MKTNARNFLTLLLGGFLAACAERGGFERRLAEADSLMLVHPDSAYRMLCAMNGRADSVAEPLRMRHLLMRSHAQNKAYVPFRSDSAGNLLTDYFDSHGTPNERMLAHYVCGCAYRDMGDEPAALRHFNRAIASADTSATNCDFYQLGLIYGQIAGLFEQRYLTSEALEAYNLAEKYARKTQDSLGLLDIRTNKSALLLKQGELASLYHSLGHSHKADTANRQFIQWFFLHHDFENDDFRPDYHIKGTYHLELGELDSAEFCFRKMQDVGRSVNDRYQATWGLTRLYLKRQQLDSVAKYALQTYLYCDTLYNISAAQNLQNAQAMYNYNRHRERAERKEREARESRRLLYNWMGGSALSLVGLAALLLLLRKQNRQLRQRVEVFQKEVDRQTQSRDRNALNQHPAVLRLIGMAKSRRELPTFSDWQAVYPPVEDCFPEMARIRQMPDISDFEYHICVLIKLGCEIQDIVFLTDTNNAHIATSRRRLLTKIFHTEEGGCKEFDRRLREI